MLDAAGFDRLLSALRGAGLRIGVAEVERLHRVFELRPAGLAEPGRLASLLAAVVAKSVAERRTVERLTASFLDQQLASRGATPRFGKGRGEERSRAAWWTARRHLGWSLLVVAALAILVPEVVYRWAGRPTPIPVTRASQERRLLKPEPVGQPSPIRSTEDEDWRNPPFPQDPPGPDPYRPQAYWVGVVLATLGGAASLALLAYFYRRRGLPAVPELVLRRGPSQVYLTAVESTCHELLSADAEDALVWGVDRYVSEQPTRRLDLDATVEATARDAGLPRLIFERASYPREVWLWLDEAAGRPEIERLAAEIESSLRAHGLPVERATFRGLPERLLADDGRLFAPRDVDDRRDTAWVAVLTDGRVLMRRWAADDQRASIEALLRTLAGWPRLAWVDFSTSGDALAPLTDRHSLRHLQPEQLAHYLGGAARPAQPAAMAAAERAWAAATAVPASPVPVATALELRRHLGLPPSPRALAELRAAAPGPPGRLAFSSKRRASLLGWLGRSELLDRQDNGLLRQSLDFWRHQYDGEAARRQQAAGLQIWQDTPSELRLRAERALLDLWHRPAVAVEQLHDLYQAPTRAFIEGQLALYAPRGVGRANGQVPLPWHWRDQPDLDRARWQEMGLGGRLPAERLRRPGRLWLAAALCLGLGVVGGSQAWEKRGELRSYLGGVELVHVPGGSFQMGTSKEDDRGDDDERPPHEVTLEEFWIMPYEATWGDLRRALTAEPLLGDHLREFTRVLSAAVRERVASEDLSDLANYLDWPYRDLDWRDKDEKQPIAGVSWPEALAICQALGMRLPTEAEWEFACRANTETAWSFGDKSEIAAEFAVFNPDPLDLLDGETVGKFFAEHSPSRVGSKRANPWGLYDLHGNLLEWVWDWYGDYSEGAPPNPIGPEEGDFRVLRGGSFIDPAQNLRSAYRLRYRPGFRDRFIGFRCVRSPRRQR